MARQLVGISGVTLIFIAVFYAGIVGAHGQVSMEEDSCMRRMGDSMVHLSAYQPQYEPSAHYCTEIPKAGDTFLVLDLVDQALRDMPVGMRVVKGASATEDETITLFNPSHHPDGVISGKVNLDQGIYTVFITGEGAPPVQYQYSLRVEMINYMNIFRATIGPLIFILLLSFVGYKIMKSKRVQRWRETRRS